MGEAAALPDLFPHCQQYYENSWLYKVILPKFSYFPKTTIWMESKQIFRAVFDIKALERELG